VKATTMRATPGWKVEIVETFNLKRGCSFGMPIYIASKEYVVGPACNSTFILYYFYIFYLLLLQFHFHFCIFQPGVLFQVKGTAWSWSPRSFPHVALCGRLAYLQQ